VLWLGARAAQFAVVKRGTILLRLSWCRIPAGNAGGFQWRLSRGRILMGSCVAAPVSHDGGIVAPLAGDR